MRIVLVVVTAYYYPYVAAMRKYDYLERNHWKNMRYIESFFLLDMLLNFFKMEDD